MIDPKHIRPLNGMVLLYVGTAEKTEGGLFVPDQSKLALKKRKGALVVAVSEGRWTAQGVQPPTVKPGERVWMKPGCEPAVNGELPEHVFVHQDDILCSGAEPTELPESAAATAGATAEN